MASKAPSRRASATPRAANSRYSDPTKIQTHYDLISPYYRTLWGAHLHHGYWIRGDETKEQAQLQLVEHLASAAAIRPGVKLLDVGCGFGASSLYLAGKYAVDATGITISPVQVEMACSAAAVERVPARFLLMDAQAMTFPPASFDVVWSIESISHYQRKKDFFAAAAHILKPQGTFALIDWFKKEGLDRRSHARAIRPIERGMMVALDTIEDYAALLQSNGLRVTQREILNDRCAKTWDLCLEIIRNRQFWTLAARLGPDFLHFLRAFRAMKAGFASGNFLYALLIAQKP